MAITGTQHQGSEETFKKWRQNWSIKDACWVAEKLGRRFGSTKAGSFTTSEKTHHNQKGQLLPTAVALQAPCSAFCRQRLTSGQVAKEKREQGLALVTPSRTEKGGFYLKGHSVSFLRHLPSSLSFFLLLPASLSLLLASILIGLRVVLMLIEFIEPKCRLFVQNF